MHTRRHILAGLGAAAAARVTPAAAQDAFPDHPLRLVVPFPPGGTTDVFARVFASRFGEALGASVVVDNRGGAGGLIGGGEVNRARPDGYTLIFHSPTSGIAGPLTRRVPPYRPLEGFEHVAILGYTPMILAVSPRLGVNTLPELVDLLRRQPGRHSYGSSGIGGVPHLTTELFRARAGNLDIVHVPYRGAAGAIQDTIAGNVTFVVDTFAPLLPLHQGGQLKVIAIFGEERAAVAPEVPTAREAGFDVVMRNTNYLSAPPGTPADRLERLSAAARTVMGSPEMAAELARMAYVPVIGSTPASARDFIAHEVTLWGSIIQAAHIEVE
ncbi:MAG TPA: tripartite tricarboxylate transporter substrate binding protein [Roseomonas sp.]